MLAFRLVLLIYSNTTRAYRVVGKAHQHQPPLPHPTQPVPRVRNTSESNPKNVSRRPVDGSEPQEQQPMIVFQECQDRGTYLPLIGAHNQGPPFGWSREHRMSVPAAVLQRILVPITPPPTLRYKKLSRRYVR